MSSMSMNNHYDHCNNCIECKKKHNQIEEYDKIISSLRAKIIVLQDELLLAQKEIIEYQGLINLKRIDYVDSASHSNDDDSGQWHISSERQRDFVHNDQFKLFFGNIVSPITKNLLINRIENDFGRVVEYYKDPISPFAFVHFADSSGYYTALNQGSIRVEGVNVRIEMPRPKRT
ncbi:hypothetical protein C1645_821147 [Glomus cerebriforme]|uniref:RRM domain-containing protein n=1 Tax=Glomus cerebriforme TaxID=658196 RepID=A0A397T6U8_9GLOM|nr:hypothetical protein C1645_821147 [Glomus cerebriforme]